MAEPTNDAVSDEQLQEIIDGLLAGNPTIDSPEQHVEWLTGGLGNLRAALNRRSVTSQASEGEAEPFNTGVGWENLSCDDQFTLATRIAANIGYELTPEPSIQEAEDRALASPSKRVERLETALSQIDRAWEAATSGASTDIPNITGWTGALDNLGQIFAWVARQALQGGRS